MARHVEQSTRAGRDVKPESEIVHRQMPELVAATLREMIMRGELQSGEGLPMRTLADRFGVSVIPVRDALRLLAGEGLVELRPHKGARVVTISLLDLEQIFVARLPLEQLAATKALGSMTTTDIRGLVRLEGQMERTTDPRRWLELNRRFHTDMYLQAGYPRIVRIIEGLWDLVEPHLLLFMRNREAVRNAEAEHRAMIAAIEAGDAPELRRLVEKHLKGAAAHLARILGDVDEVPEWARLNLEE